MIGRVKQFFGIEGVKVKFNTEENQALDKSCIEGGLFFYSKKDQTVSHVKVRFYEIYSKGRKESKTTEVFELGEWTYDKAFDVSDQSPAKLVVDLKYNLLKSNVDKIAEDGFILKKQLAKMALKFNKVSSKYFLEVEAIVEGTKLNPFDKMEVFLVD